MKINWTFFSFFVFILGRYFLQIFLSSGFNFFCSFWVPMWMKPILQCKRHEIVVFFISFPCVVSFFRHSLSRPRQRSPRHWRSRQGCFCWNMWAYSSFLYLQSYFPHYTILIPFSNRKVEPSLQPNKSSNQCCKLFEPWTRFEAAQLRLRERWFWSSKGHNFSAEYGFSFFSGFVLCHRGNDSQRAILLLRDRYPGSKFMNIRGGLEAWAEQVDTTFLKYWSLFCDFLWCNLEEHVCCSISVYGYGVRFIDGYQA